MYCKRGDKDLGIVIGAIAAIRWVGAFGKAEQRHGRHIG